MLPELKSRVPDDAKGPVAVIPPNNSPNSVLEYPVVVVVVVVPVVVPVPVLVPVPVVPVVVDVDVSKEPGAPAPIAE